MLGEVAADFNIQLTNDMKIVAYKSENKITNTGDKAWTKEGWSCICVDARLF